MARTQYVTKENSPRQGRWFSFFSSLLILLGVILPSLKPNPTQSFCSCLHSSWVIFKAVWRGIMRLISICQVGPQSTPLRLYFQTCQSIWYLVNVSCLLRMHFTLSVCAICKACCPVSICYFLFIHAACQYLPSPIKACFPVSMCYLLSMHASLSVCAISCQGMLTCQYVPSPVKACYSVSMCHLLSRHACCPVSMRHLLARFAALPVWNMMSMNYNVNLLPRWWSVVLRYPVVPLSHVVLSLCDILWNINCPHNNKR